MLVPRQINADRQVMPDEFAFMSDDFSVIANILKDESGISLNPSKAMLVYSRLAKRVRARSLENFRAYCELIRSDSAERQLMVEALTTNTTSFFREQHHFEHLAEVVLPPLLDTCRSGRRVRLWSSACSAGHEPYSMAMTVANVAPDVASLDLKILATDINGEMIKRATAGVYSREDTSTVPRAMASKFLVGAGSSTNRESEIAPVLKRLIRFRILNLFSDWPMKGAFDVIFCRNVMIYFDAETQARLWSKLGAKLHVGGYIYIGHSERLTGPAAAGFQQVAVTTYQKMQEVQ